jgi:hypothetical protein
VGGVAVLIMNNGRSAFLSQEQHYQMAGQRADGYYCGIVDEQAVLSTLTENGFRCSYEASNTFQSIGKHLLRHYVSRDLNRPILDALFALCAELDIEFRNKGDLDQLFADQFLVKAEKICAR